jgi:hypothetical protein
MTIENGVQLPATFDRYANRGTFSGGSYYGGLDLSAGGQPGAGLSMDSTKLSGLDVGKGIGASVVGFLANPVVGAGIGLISLVGKGIGAWMNWKNQQAAKREADAREQERLRREKEALEREYEMENLRMKQTWEEFLDRRTNDRFERKKQTDATNYQRANDYINNFISMINSDDALRQGFVNRWR